MATGLRKAAGAAAVTTAACITSVALADVTVQQHISVEGVGLMAAVNMSGTTKTAISGDRSRTDSDIKLESRMMRMLAHRTVGPTAEIIRLDQDKIDRLDVSRKQYTELTFEEMKVQLQKAVDQLDQASQKPMDDSKCEWLDPKVEVRRPGEKATYAGYDSERLTIVASQPCKDKETGAICEVALALDEWLAPAFTPNVETERFSRAYAQKLGLDPTSGRGNFGGGDIRERARAMFGRYAGIWDQIVAKTKDVKGYPVKMSFSFAFGGAQCKNAQSQQQPQQGANDSDGGNSNTPAGLAGQMAGKLGSLFHRKKDDDSQQQATQTPSLLPGGLLPLITLTSQVESISTDSVSPTLFEVPTDFKKVERKGDKPAG
jgi:hypothetical protein